MLLLETEGYTFGLLGSYVYICTFGTKWWIYFSFWFTKNILVIVNSIESIENWNYLYIQSLSKDMDLKKEIMCSSGW